VFYSCGWTAEQSIKLPSMCWKGERAHCMIARLGYLSLPSQTHEDFGYAGAPFRKMRSGFIRSVVRPQLIEQRFAPAGWSFAVPCVEIGGTSNLEGYKLGKLVPSYQFQVFHKRRPCVHCFQSRATGEELQSPQHICTRHNTLRNI
jgi:hypothetical protein